MAAPLNRSGAHLQTFDEMQLAARDGATGKTYVQIPNSETPTGEIVAADHAIDGIEDDGLNLPGLTMSSSSSAAAAAATDSTSKTQTSDEKKGKQTSIVMLSPIPPRGPLVNLDEALMSVAAEKMDTSNPLAWHWSRCMCMPCRGNPRCVGCQCVGACSLSGESDEYVGAVITATDALMEDHRYVPAGCACIPAFCCLCCKKSCMEDPHGSCAVALCRQSCLRKCCVCYSNDTARATSKKWVFIGVVIAFILGALALGLVSHFAPLSLMSN